MTTISKSNGNRTEWSPIRSVIMRVIRNSDNRAAGVRFVYHHSFAINHKNYNFREKKNSQVMKQRQNLHQETDKGGVNF